MEEITIDELAKMINRQFNSIHTEIGGLKQDFGGLKQDIEELKQGQEKIMLRLDHTAHKFETKDHEKRITRLETDVKVLKAAKC